MDDARTHRIEFPPATGLRAPRRHAGFEAFDFALNHSDDDDHDGGESLTRTSEPHLDAPEAWHERESERSCPHVDRNDARCGHRFSLGRLEQAFNVCFGAFHACPIYQRISSEVAIDDDSCAASPCAARGPQRTLVEVRIVGHLANDARRVGELRQTGS